MDLHECFKMGAKMLAASGAEYTDLHKGHGIDKYEWQMLTKAEYWSPDEARQMRSIISNIVEVSMTIAGLPAVPLPGQYVAAVIATVVAPCNRWVAVLKAPDTFDAMDASGLLSTVKNEEEKMSYQQMMALVLAYSADYIGEPPAKRLPKQMRQQVKEANGK